MKPIIRKMREDDWDQFQVHDAETFPDDLVNEEWFKSRVERDGCFMMNLDGEFIGQLIVSRFGDDDGHLNRIGLSKRHRRKGYGHLLMDYAMNWFRSQDGVRSVHLYTQHDNFVAQSLYKEFGFVESGTTWHYFVPFSSLNPSDKYIGEKIKENEIEEVGHRYKSLPAAQIRRFLTYDEYLVLTLKDASGDIQGAARFTPSFPGSFPFEISQIDCFDDFVYGMKEFSLPDFDYVRVTFTDNPDLAELCAKRDYRLHHRLFKMTHILK